MKDVKVKEIREMVAHEIARGETSTYRIMRNLRKKQGGFSLPGILVAALIAALLGAAAISNLWPAVDKTKVTSEYSTIQNLKNVMGGVVGELNGFPGSFDVTTDQIVKGSVASIPSDFNYSFVLADNGNADINDDLIITKVVAKDEVSAEKLKTIVAGLNERLDGPNETNPETEGDFQYNVTCSNPANIATSATDCYYVVRGLARGYAGNAVTNLLTISVDGTNAMNSDLDTVAPDRVAPLNY